MRGTQPLAASNAACPGMMSLSPGFPASSPSGRASLSTGSAVDDPGPPTGGESVYPTTQVAERLDRLNYVLTNPNINMPTNPTYTRTQSCTYFIQTGTRSTIVHLPEDDSSSEGKPLPAPDSRVSNRRAEEEGNGKPRSTKASQQVLHSGQVLMLGSVFSLGAGVNKRIRSITYPSLLSRTRKAGPYDSIRRVRSSSLCFPPPLPVSRSNVFMPSSLPNTTNAVSTTAVSPQVKVKRTLLRPALLVAPGPWSSRDVPHLRQVTLNTDEEISRVTIDFPPSALGQRTLPQDSRSLLETDSAIAGRIQFVFGENMSERVLSPQKRPCSEDMSDSDCSSSDSDSSSSEASNTMTVRSSLWESAAAYTAACKRSCLLKRVQVFTGEENESNVIQLTCKLFVLERGTQSWSERGRGVLRLNDLETGTKGSLQSRMVMRHQGSLKLILNTKLYPHTHLRRPARRNLQVTATDLESHSVRVFLIQASARDIARLYVAIHHRLVALRCSATSLTGEGTAFRERDGHCSSEEEEEEEEEKVKEDKDFYTHEMSGDCNWRHSHSRFCP
ncbi:hypothetical protein NFI96_022784 [Prochilodus magdalenae]|nr:hypothetical protein NFI96_022784 [Prochilodus magdalenae]